MNVCVKYIKACVQGVCVCVAYIAILMALYRVLYITVITNMQTRGHFSGAGGGMHCEQFLGRQVWATLSSRHGGMRIRVKGAASQGIHLAGERQGTSDLQAKPGWTL